MIRKPMISDIPPLREDEPGAPIIGVIVAVWLSVAVVAVPYMLFQCAMFLWKML